METLQKVQNALSAEKTAGRLRQFLELRRSGKSARFAAERLGIPFWWVVGVNCYLTRFEDKGIAGLAREDRRSKALAVGEHELPPWFVIVARYFYLISNTRREGGSVPEAVLRTIELPHLPTGWNNQHRAQIENWLAKSCGLKEMPVCPPRPEG